MSCNYIKRQKRNENRRNSLARRSSKRKFANYKKNIGISITDIQRRKQIELENKDENISLLNHSF